MTQDNLYDFDNYIDVLLATTPVDAHERGLTHAMQERLRTATGDDARALARAIIRGRHDDGGEVS